MRLSVRSLRRVVKGDLPIEYAQQDLTSYGGLELVRRYLPASAIWGDRPVWDQAVVIIAIDGESLGDRSFLRS